MVISDSQFSIKVSFIFPTFFVNIHVIGVQIKVVVVIVDVTKDLHARMRP